MGEPEQNNIKLRSHSGSEKSLYQSSQKQSPPLEPKERNTEKVKHSEKTQKYFANMKKGTQQHSEGAGEYGLHSCRVAGTLDEEKKNHNPTNNNGSRISFERLRAEPMSKAWEEMNCYHHEHGRARLLPWGAAMISLGYRNARTSLSLAQSGGTEIEYTIQTLLNSQNTKKKTLTRIR